MLDRVLTIAVQGLGNLINMTPTIRALKDRGLEVHVWIPQSTTPPGTELLFEGLADRIFRDESPGDIEYDAFVSTFWMEWPKEHLHRYKICQGVMDIRNFFLMHEVELNMKGVDAFLDEEDVSIPGTYVAVKKGYKTKVKKKDQRVGFHTGFGGDRQAWGRKVWHGWETYITALHEKGIKTVVFGTERDKQGWLSRLDKGMHKNLIGLDIQETAAEMQACRLFVSTDGGLAHAAAALRIDAITLFGATLVTKNRPWSPKTRVMSRHLQCQPCQYKPMWDQCNVYRCMDIAVEEVLLKTDMILSGRDKTTNRWSLFDYWNRRFEEMEPERAAGCKGGTVDENRANYEVKAAVLMDLVDKHGVLVKNVLEFGPGAGFWTDWAYTKGCSKYTGVELSSVAAGQLRKRFKNATIYEGNGANYTGTRCFDTVLALDVTQHVVDTDEFERMLRAMRRAVTKKGSVLVTGWLDGDRQVSDYEVKHSLDSYERGLAPLKLREKVPFGDKHLMVFQNG